MQVVPEAVRSEQGFQEKATARRLPRPAEQMSMAETEQADSATDRAQQALNVTAEACPEFRSTAAFMQLQDSIRYTEEQLSASRRSENAAVARLEDRRQMFPSNIAALLLGFRAEPMYRAQEHERADVDMSSLRDALARDRGQDGGR